MKDFLKVGTSEMMVNLRRNPRAKRLTLRVSSVDGKPVLTLPPRVRQREAQHFLNRQESWLRARMDAAPDRMAVVAGVTIPFLGEQLVVTPHAKSRVTLAPGHLMVPEVKHIGTSVAGFLKTRARLTVTELSTKYATKLGEPFGRISLRDPRSRWGSCSSDGNLMYSWRLILAPSKVLEYVVAHEIAHLAEMNHSAAFWQIVADLMPEFETHRQWFKQHGPSLHRFDFKAGLT